MIAKVIAPRQIDFAPSRTNPPTTLSTDSTFSEWSQRLRASDRTAFQALFKATYPALCRYATGFTGDATVAQDLVQDAFLRIWNRRATLDPARSLQALLYVTVRNLALNHERTTAKRQTLLTTMDAPAPSPEPDAAVAADLLRERLQGWIREMPARRREAFQLSRFDGLSYEEIAGVMGLSVRTVEQHIRLALQHLRGRLREQEPELLRP